MGNNVAKNKKSKKSKNRAKVGLLIGEGCKKERKDSEKV